jgi:hypothetical protein
MAAPKPTHTSVREPTATPGPPPEPAPVSAVTYTTRGDQLELRDAQDTPMITFALAE